MTLLDIPVDPREEVTRRVFALADALDWPHLNISERSRHYRAWVADPTIGGELEKLVGAERVHMTIKDAIMRDYMIARRLGLDDLLKRMGIRHDHVTRRFEKPRAVLCDRNRLYTLTVAKEWRIALLSAFERAVNTGDLRENLVLVTDHHVGSFTDRSYKEMVEAAGERLDVRVHWVQ